MELVRTYLADFEEFGLVAFETRPRLEGQHGGGDTEYATLNEDQAALLISYMRNSAIVREFKKRLIRAFSNMKRQLEQLRDPMRLLEDPDTLKSLLLASMQQREEQQEKIEERNKIIADLSPKAQVAERLNGAEGNLSIRNAAKALKMKEHKFVNWLQVKKLAFRNKKGKLEGYADHVPRYLDHKVYPIPTDAEPDRVSFQLVITPEGLVRFAKMLNVELHEQSQIAEAV